MGKLARIFSVVLFLSLFFLVIPAEALSSSAHSQQAESHIAVRLHSIYSHADGPGQIWPSGTVRVRHGANRNFRIIPSEACRIVDVTVDGVSQGSIASYTFYRVTTDHTITATFIRETWQVGQSDFYSPLPVHSWSGPGGILSPTDSNNSNNRRVIEEGDIVKLDTNTLYVLNQYRGLQIIDVTTPNQPALRSVLPIPGQPVELYVRGTTVYLVLSNQWVWVYNALQAPTQSLPQSQVVTVDVTDLASPRVLARIDLDGTITDTRMVGDVFYLVGSGSSSSSSGEEASTVVYALSVADPANARLVDELAFAAAAGCAESNVHVTESLVFVAQATWGFTDTEGNWIDRPTTSVTCLDISDLQGSIRQGATFTVPGMVNNRWQMDCYQGFFRVITPDRSWGNGYPSLYIYQVESPQTIRLLSSLTLVIDRPESLSSVRFDKERAYAVTYERIDPLFTLDLSNPEHPRQAGEIEMTGWIDYIEPRTDHLVTLGHDQAENTTSLAVSLFDVTAIDTPTMSDRVGVGEEYGWLPAEMNDLHKAFKVLDAVNLVLVPFSFWSSTTSSEVSGVQLIDYFFTPDRKDLVRRGFIAHPGWVQRAVPYDPATLFTFSNESLQSVDISNRDNPLVTKVLHLARNVADLGELGTDTGVELSLDSRGYALNNSQTTLSVVPLIDPNTAEPAVTTSLNGSYDQLFKTPNAHLLVGSRDDADQGSLTTLQAVAFDGTGFRSLGFLELAELSPSCYSMFAAPAVMPYPYRQTPEVTQVSDTGFVLTAPQCFCLGMRTTSSGPALTMQAIDASDPQSLQRGADVEVDLEGGQYLATLWRGPKAYVSYAVPFPEFDSLAYWRCYVKTVDFSDLYLPAVSLGINIPGSVVGVSDDRRYIYTVDYQYVPNTPAFSGTGSEVYLNTLELSDTQALLRDREKICPSGQSAQETYYCGKVVVADEHAYAVVTHTLCQSDYSSCRSDAILVTVDLRDPNDLQVQASQALTAAGAEIVDLQAGKLFLYTYDGSGGIFVYSLVDPRTPQYESFTRIACYPKKIVLMGKRAYLPSGMYGTIVIPLP